MNKKTILAIIITMFCVTTAIYAQPPPPFDPWGWGPPPPHHHHDWGWGYPGDHGLANAAAITSIVASGVSIMSNLAAPRTTTYVQPVAQPVIAQPVAQPVIVQPTVIQPAVQTVIYQ